MKARHLTIQELNHLKKGALSAEEKLAALAHIGECDHCAEALAKCYEEEVLLTITPDFSKGVFHKIEELEKRAEQRKLVPLKKGKNFGGSSKNQLYAYGFRVSIAACVTLLLLFSGTFGNGMQWINKGIAQNPDWRGISKITETVREFSDRMLPNNLLNDQKDQKGGWNNDKEKK